MLRRSFVGIGLLLAGATLAGCVPHWRVVSESIEDPMAGQRHFALAPIDFTGLRIGTHTEEEYLAGKDSGQQASFAQDKEAMNAEFAQALEAKALEMGVVIVRATGPADAPFLIRPSVSFIEPGFYAVVVAAPSQVDMNLKITGPDGRLFDEILLTHRTAGNLDITASSGGRLRKDGTGLGVWVAEYLKHRIFPG